MAPLLSLGATSATYSGQACNRILKYIELINQGFEDTAFSYPVPIPEIIRPGNSILYNKVSKERMNQTKGLWSNDYA